MYKIQANQSGTRSIEVSDLHLETIDKYQLLRNLVDSNGIIDEEVLEKLKLNVRSLLEADNCQDKNLLDLCLDVIYNFHRVCSVPSNYHTSHGLNTFLIQSSTSCGWP